MNDRKTKIFTSDASTPNLYMKKKNTNFRRIEHSQATDIRRIVKIRDVKNVSFNENNRLCASDSHSSRYSQIFIRRSENMDVLKAEIAKKRKLLEDKNLVVSFKLNFVPKN